MPITISEIVTGVRDYLLLPDYATLSKSTLLLRIDDKQAYYQTSLKIANRNWFVNRTTIYVDPSRDEYSINADSFGRPFQCLTKDDTDPNHIERDVEIVTLQNRDLYYQGTKQGSTSFSYPHVAACMSFFNENGQWKVKVTPQHTQAATYEVWYSPDKGLPPVLADNLQLVDSFANLFKVDVALSCLPNLVKMDDKGNVLNGGQLTMLERRLMDDRNRYEAQFNVYRTMVFQEQTGPRRGFAEDAGYEQFF